MGLWGAGLVGWWGCRFGDLPFGARLVRGGVSLVGSGLGCFGWAGSDSWFVFAEPVVEGGSGALVVHYECVGHYCDPVGEDVESLAAGCDCACSAVGEEGFDVAVG